MDRHSSGAERRRSLRHSLANDGSDDEDYALATMAISDGVRPSDLEHNAASSQNSQNHERRVSNVHPYRDLRAVPIPPPRPSSILKPNHDSLTLQHDGAMGPIVARSAAAATSSNAVLSRSSSVSTDVPLRPESPYQGPSGPSHPYQMYPQESRLARTASTATASTAPVPERSYAGPSAPTYPYGMYPQNTVPETEDEHDEQAAAPVPVGFLGRSNDYQRRLGPDGEEIADIIGPDGHTEQLPPYSKYPEEAFARKDRPTVQLPVASGAGGMGLATRNPEFASREDLNSPDSRLSSRILSAVDSGSQNSTAAAVVSEKPPLKKWQKFAKRKVCGVVPTWALILAAAVLVILVIIMLLVLVALRPRHPNHNSEGGDTAQGVVYTTTLTTTFDATPLSTTPTAMPTLPTGTYALPISTPTTQQSGCLQNAAQNVAWTCVIAPALPYQVEISSIPGGSPTSNNEITLTLGDDNMTFLPYGALAPIISQYQVMGLVIDSQSPGRGPAWFSQTTYNKIVVLPEESLEVSSNYKRQNRPKRRSSAFTGRKGIAQPGEHPWICYWNGTVLETFIYVNQTSSSGSSSSTSSSMPSNSATPTSTSPYGAAYSSNSDPNFLSQYPKVIKLQERRVPSGYPSVSPYCVQQQIGPYGNATPLLNSTGQPIIIYLNETEPATASPLADRSNLYDRVEKRDKSVRERGVTQECGCVWLST